MKYIRTKFGAIFKVYNGKLKDEQREEEIRVFYPKYIIKKMSCPYAWASKADIIKQADAIEELCDYWDFYDLLDNEYKIKPINLYSVGVMRTSLERKTARDIKLVIRTDRGLIYVAKMNEKGKLELL